VNPGGGEGTMAQDQTAVDPEAVVPIAWHVTVTSPVRLFKWDDEKKELVEVVRQVGRVV
jgi:hypothetical protein